MSSSAAITRPPASLIGAVTGPDEAHRLSWRAALVIAVYGASLFAVHLGDVRALTFHEIVFAQPAREMVREGRWLVPTIGGQPQFDRTPVTAWCIAVAMTLTGSEAEWVVRLPSVLATLATALMVAAMTARWFGSRAALWAGLMQLTTYYALAMGRLAEADMLLCATVTAALFAFAAAHIPGGSPSVTNSRRLPWLFHAALAISFMVKWALGPALILGGCAAYGLVARDRRVVKFVLNPIGIAISLLIVVPWFAAAYVQYPSVLEHIYINHFRRFNGDMGMLEPWYSYFYDVPLLVLPWSPYVALAVFAQWRRSGPVNPFWRLAACWFLPGIVLLSASSFHSRNYAIALLPPLTIAAAVGFSEYLRRRETSDNPLRRGLIALSIAGGAVGAALLLRRSAADAEALAMLALTGAAGVVTALVYEGQRRPNAAAAALFATMWLVAVGTQTWVMPAHDSFRPLADLGRRIGTSTPAGAVVHILHLPEVQVPYYIERRVQSWPKADAFAAHLAASGKPQFVVTSQDYVDHVAGFGKIEVIDQARRTARYQEDRDRLVLLKVSPTEKPVAATAAETSTLRR